jgi:nucleoside-diphosphate-sugar epimerase
VIKAMIGDALANRPTHLPYGAGFPRQFVHVSDVASSVLAALTTSRGIQKAYNISDGTRYLLDDVAMLVRDRLPDAKIDLADGPDPDDVVCGRLDIVAAKTELDWEPEIDLPAGIDLMIAGLSGRT